MSDRVVGLIGGMGPEATVDLMKKIIRYTPVSIEQDHIRLLVDSNPKIPCRVKAIFEGEPSPGPVMAEMAQGLERVGAEVLAIPCNTAHYYISEVINAVSIPVLSIIDETVKVLITDGVEKVALLASSALLKTKLYINEIDAAGISLLLPEESYQEKIMQTMFAIKTGKLTTAHELMREVMDHIHNLGATAAVLGCTELPLVVKEGDYPTKIYDPTTILAKAIIREAKQFST